MKVGDQFELVIEKMSLRGGGLGRHQGMVVFVDFAAPQDRLLVELTEVKRNHAFARLLHIINASPERRPPPCPVFSECGGCQWQHLSESAQSHWKQQLVQEQLERALNLTISFEPFCQSPRPWRYRNRIQLKKRGPRVGYFARGSHQLIEIKDCLIAEEPLIELIPRLQSQTQKSDLESWEIALGEEPSATLKMIGEREPGFSQVNRFVNDLLIDEVLQWSCRGHWNELLDLYCGAGNFTFPLLEKNPKASGVGVELSQASHQLATSRASSRGWSQKRVQFFCSDVGHFLRRASPSAGSLILVDPPRAGLDREVTEALALSGANQVLYVSCDPASLARDLKIFFQRGPQWRLGRVRCFDMFPQTDHVETLVEIVRRD